MEPINFSFYRLPSIQERQDHVNSIKNDALGSHRRDLGIQNGQHPADIEATGMELIGILLRIQEKEAVVFQGRDIPTKGFGIGNNAAGIFFEGNENARFTELAGAVDQIL